MEKKISILGLFANIILGILKIGVGIFSLSGAIFAEGIHSAMDVISSAINYIGVAASKKPADKKHPYGYAKAQVISGFLITVILFISGMWIMYDAFTSLLNPSDIVVNYISLGVMVFSAFLNEAMARLKIFYGKKYDNISLLSDGVHSRVDVLTSAAVIAGLLAFEYIGFVYADSIVAFAIGLYIISQSIRLGRSAAGSLLDVSAGEEIENRIREIAKNSDIILSGLKTIKRGPSVFANLKISLPSSLSVEKASQSTKQLEKKLLEGIKSLEYVTIEIASHDISESYYRGFLGRGMNWQVKGRMGGEALGPGGYCVCEKCGYRKEHERGIPCSSMLCPKCGSKMKRSDRNA